MGRSAVSNLSSNWPLVARLLLASRAIDRIEETELAPAGKVTYQFSSRGHDLAQILLGLQLTHPHDGAAVYYRSRPFMLSQGLTAQESFAADMAKTGSPFSKKTAFKTASSVTRNSPVNRCTRI